ncbi:MAG: FAD:protein FMN transferase [Pseudomonadales bacterium]|nr:FAD:protein FMN transferase [Pseudomonadales bacterium]
MPLSFEVEARPHGFTAVTFDAMASPCEILLESIDHSHVVLSVQRAVAEVKRIEAKFSRYRSDSVISRINQQAGTITEVDEETAKLINFAAQAYVMSEGMFDITSGVLRRVWRFDGTDRIPSQAAVKRVSQHVGFNKVRWKPPRLLLAPEMEIDLGGMGKEYAADIALACLQEDCDVPVLVNLGGDLCCNRAPTRGGWQIGVEQPDSLQIPVMVLDLVSGALATSGDTHRFLLKNGRRYSHLLNPKTGWPVEGGPRSVTVAAPHCVEAGMLASFALLQGANAEEFLRQQDVQFWCLW